MEHRNLVNPSQTRMPDEHLFWHSSSQMAMEDPPVCAQMSRQVLRFPPGHSEGGGTGEGTGVGDGLGVGGGLGVGAGPLQFSSQYSTQSWKASGSAGHCFKQATSVPPGQPWGDGLGGLGGVGGGGGVGEGVGDNVVVAVVVVVVVPEGGSVLSSTRIWRMSCEDAPM